MVETRRLRRNFAILLLIMSLMYLAMGAFDLLHGETYKTIPYFLYSLILLLLFWSKITESFVTIRNEDIVINKNLFHSEAIKWRDIQGLSFPNPYTAELLLSCGRKIDVIMSGIFMPKRRKKEIESLFQNIKDHFELSRKVSQDTIPLQKELMENQS